MTDALRRLIGVLGALALVSAPVSAQTPSQDTLPPRAYWRLALRAKTADSVETRLAEWRAMAAQQPANPAPRLALAMLSRFSYRYADALQWLDSAARVATTPMWRAATARERASALLSRGELTEVGGLLNIALADSLDVPREELAETKFVEMGYKRRTLARVTLASVDSVAALASATDSILHGRLSCLRASLDPPRRMAHAESGMSILRAANAPSLAGNCEFTLATLYQNEGNIGSALLWFKRAQTTARAARDEQNLAIASQWYAFSLSTIGYVTSSQTAAAEAIRTAQRIDDRNTEAWSLLTISSMAQSIGDLATMSSALRRAGILFDATGDAGGKQNQLLGEARGFMMLGDLASAEQIGRRAKAFGDSLQQPSMSLRSLYMLSDIAVRRNRLSDAGTMLDSAAPLVEMIGGAYRTQLTKYRGTVELRRGNSGEAIRLLSEARKGYAPAQSLYLYELDGALSLAWLQGRDSAKAAETLIRANEELDDIRNRLASGRMRQVLGTQDYWGGSGTDVDRVIEAFVQSSRWLPTAFAVTERARSRALLKGAFGSESNDTAATNAATARMRASATVLRDVQRDLKPNTALLVYAGGSAPSRTALMVITKTSARGITLAPSDSLDRDIVRWLALMESGESGAGAGRQVAASVLGSALQRLPSSITRLIIVPSGPLYRVPFHAIPVGRGVLGDRAIITISPSVSLAMAYAADPRAVPGRVLAMGAGDTEIASAVPQSMELNIERSDRGNPLAPLIAAADEARTAANWGHGSLAITGAAASESALKRESRGGYTVLHAAAHAVTSDQALGANWLILRPDSVDDGYVSGGELAEMSIGRSMVVLSGCRTTGDFGSSGDAIDGLVAPLLARGVRTVIASHWAVSDRWTKVLMERFYQSLATGATAADAMNQAQTSLRRAGVPARFWAAFSVIGDGALRFTPNVGMR